MHAACQAKGERGQILGGGGYKRGKLDPEWKQRKGSACRRHYFITWGKGRPLSKNEKAEGHDRVCLGHEHVGWLATTNKMERTHRDLVPSRYSRVN